MNRRGFFAGVLGLVGIGAVSKGKTEETPCLFEGESLSFPQPYWRGNCFAPPLLPGMCRDRGFFFISMDRLGGQIAVEDSEDDGYPSSRDWGAVTVERSSMRMVCWEGKWFRVEPTLSEHRSGILAWRATFQESTAPRYKMQHSNNPRELLDFAGSDKDLLDDEKAKLLAQWERAMSGPENHGKLLVPPVPKEMDYPQSWGDLRSFVLSAHGNSKRV